MKTTNLLRKSIGLFLLLASLTFLVTGCATNVTPEDKQFFYDTWLQNNGLKPIQ